MALIKPGTDVEVRSSFDGEWLRGFEVVEAVLEPVAAYRIRRRSDRFVLSRPFGRHDVREARTTRGQRRGRGVAFG